jgi:Uncharacterized conserved protein (DUF2163)
MPKILTPAMRAHLDAETTHLAAIWRITRKDGETFFFTDHDRDIVFGGDTYRADAGFERTAIRSDAGFAVDNLDLVGVFAEGVGRQRQHHPDVWRFHRRAARGGPRLRPTPPTALRPCACWRRSGSPAEIHARPVMTLDVRRRLDPRMAEALARSDALFAEFGPVAPDDIALRRAAYAHERAFWNAVPVELASRSRRARVTAMSWA